MSSSFSIRYTAQEVAQCGRCDETRLGLMLYVRDEPVSHVCKACDPDGFDRTSQAILMEALGWEELTLAPGQKISGAENP